jgi:hypothetical protein
MSSGLWVATRKGLFRYEAAASASGGYRLRHQHFLGDPVSAVLVLDEGRRVLAALDHGHFGCKMQLSEDGGDHWREIAAPTYPPKPEGVEDLDPFRKTPIPWTTKLIWTLEAGHADRPEEVWAGTIPGGLFRSVDGGLSWEINRPLWDMPERKQWVGGGADFAGIHSIASDPRDARRLLVGVSCGGVWVTDDEGRSWKQSAHGMRSDYAAGDDAYLPDQQDPHCIKRSAADPNRLWCQHHNGIFRSDDGGTRWIEIENARPSAFGFGVVAHPKDPDTAWFVPAVKDEKRYPVDGRLVVSRTRDGGASFEVLGTGLPAEHAFDLVYRHAFDGDSSGEKLALGSTTGNLWVGEGGGERFHLLSSHLPPIYALRFSD